MKSLFYSDDALSAHVFNAAGCFVGCNLSPEVMSRFVNSALETGSVSVAFEHTSALVCVLEGLGYLVTKRPMTYTYRVFGDLLSDRNFDILDVVL